MNARGLLLLDDENDQETREQVRERLWEALMGDQPRGAVRATLAASRLGKHQLRRTLERLLVQAALENEAVWWELFEALPTCRRATLELGKRVATDFFDLQSPRRQVALLEAALERQSKAPTQGYSLILEGAAVRTALLLALTRRCAETNPIIELRHLLEPLKRCTPTLRYNAPELVEDVLEVSAKIESVTRGLKDLPLPTTAAPDTTNLPLPATAQEGTEPTDKRAESSLWDWLKTKLGDRDDRD
jgi:hypothetical protein